MSEIVLECRGVKKSFQKDGQKIEVLRGVNLQIRAGEAVAILGSSGVGKSTLLHVLGTLENPSSGQVLFSGENSQDYSTTKLANFRNRSLGFVFQFHYLLQEFSALENVLMPALIAGENRAVYAARAEELLREVGLGHRLGHRPGELSGGEQQRVAVARALIMQPKILLADEPTGNLDSVNAMQIRDLILSLNKRMGVTIAMVTHDRELAASFSRQIEMRDGEILAAH